MDWWRSHLVLTVLLAGTAGLGGCQAAPRPSLAGMRPDFLSLLELPGTEQQPLVRAQSRPSGGGSSSLLTLPRDTEPDKGTRSAAICAVVNGEAILEEEVLAAAAPLMSSVRSEKDKKELIQAKLNEIIERELLMQDAVSRLNKRSGGKFFKELEQTAIREFERQWLHRLMKANNQTDPDVFKEMLRSAGMPVEQIQRQWVRNFIAMEYLRTRLEPHLTRIGHLQLVDYYQSHPQEFRVEDSVDWQDMFIATARHPSRDAARLFAESLVSRLRKGEDFVRLAKEFDNGDSSLRENSEGIGHKRGEITLPGAEAVLFSLEEGQVGPLIEIETGFHIIRLVKRTRQGIQPFDDKVQKEVRDKIRNQVFQKEMRRMINDLKRNAIIEMAGETK